MAVIDMEITKREPYAGGRSFGDHGAFEQIDGVLTFAVDPDHAANRSIVDLELAPRDETGRVRFRADFTLIIPQDTKRGNQRLLVGMVNRGQPGIMANFNRAAPAGQNPREIPVGDGFLYKHGFSTLCIGWQWDYRRGGDLLALEAPQAEVDGQSVRGQVMVEMRPSRHEKTRLLADRESLPYPAADTDEPDAKLLVRDWEDGPNTEIPRNEWRFARETDEGVVPSDGHVYLESGFEPGRLYYAIFTTAHAPVVGTGLLAVRDAAAFLRQASPLNPVAEGFERAYAYGVSQTGRLLRHFVYLGLNVDEEGRQVYAGILPHVAGGRKGEYNHRFAQPSFQSLPGMGHLGPFADDVTGDPFSGREDGLLKRQRELGGVPKMVYTNSSCEYWRGDGSLAHTNPADGADAQPVAETRSYLFAGTRHGAGSLRQWRNPNATDSSHPINVVDYRPLLRAALLNLDLWVTEGVEPPESRVPRQDDETAVTRRDLVESFPDVPGVSKPDPDRLWVLREMDFGPDAALGVGRYPATEGRTYPALVSKADSDGNEIAGIRLPDIEVPVGTHTGWTTRKPEAGAPEQVVTMMGFTNFFPPTRAVREATGDPRPSIEERYTSRDSYLFQVTESARRLVAERYLLEEDVDVVVADCAERYDAAVGADCAERYDAAVGAASPAGAPAGGSD